MYMKRKTIIIIAAAIIGVACGAIFTLRHATNTEHTYFNMNITAPGAERFSDDVTGVFDPDTQLPNINNNRQVSSPDALVVSYEWEHGPYAPAFKMNAADNIADAVHISPLIRGTWTMRGPNTLAFVPQHSWPANQRFTVSIDRSVLNSDAHVSTRRKSFTTPDIEYKIDEFNIYPAPSHPGMVSGAAVISYNYPVNAADFQKRVSMHLDGDSLDFHIEFDQWHRTVIITSAPVDVTARPQTMRIRIKPVAAASGDARTRTLNATATIESIDNIFKVSNISTVSADDTDGNPQQLILVSMTGAAANDTRWGRHINAYLLPRNIDNEDTDTAHVWERDEITPAVIAKSQKLKLNRVEFVNPNGEYKYAFAYDVSADAPRYMFVSVGSDIKSAAGFTMKNPVDAVMAVAYPKQTVRIAGSGALLSMGGDKKLGIMARGGVDVAHINLYKIKESEINHLISQTYNVFAQNIDFKSWSFGAYDMSIVFQKSIPFSNKSAKAVNYASLDLGEYLGRAGTDKTGIFLIQTGPTKNQAEYNDKRLILLTDLGIIRKVNADESSVVFISNLSTGTAAGDVEISVLGRNGNPVWAGRTNENGRGDIPRLAWAEYRNEREPVAIVARRGDDVSFIPYNGAYSQRVDYSRFDTNGTYGSPNTALNAFIFTDRGIYRPGESAVIGGIVKNRKFTSLDGVPVKMEITDARGRTALEKTFSLGADGMFDIKYTVPPNAVTGEYDIRLFSLNAKNTPRDVLGTAQMRVEEFTPDTMEINAEIDGASDTGWIGADAVHARVMLRNMFATPAAARRITATATLRPSDYTFDEYPDYVFTPNFISGTGLSTASAARARTITRETDDTYTDADGNANLDIAWGDAARDGTYVMSLDIRGFEPNSGTSVRTVVTTRMSNAKYLVGYHSTSDLSYIRRNARVGVDLVALGTDAQRVDVSNLTMRLIKRENMVSLVKDYNDYYKYQTVTRDNIVSNGTLDINTSNTRIYLDTNNGGTYYLQILDDSGRILANIEYFVADADNAALESDSHAELQIRLNKPEYAPGDTIEIAVTAPYAGAGLITIERDRVYAYKWFKTNATSSVQKISLPADFEGTGYINVSYLRSIDSRDIFTVPYAYAAAPFGANTARRKINVALDVPDMVDNNHITVKYTAGADARLMIFAIDAGILQVAKYRMPNPLGYFFQKAALQVETFQILSLLMPEYKILYEFAKTGGGDYDGGGELAAPLRNPFARAGRAPVAFYSGIINARKNVSGTYDIEIPEYFNGAVKIFAVAANSSAMGAADAQTRVQSPLIITQNAPRMAAPNDRFTVNAVISNMTKSSGNAHAVLSATTSENLEITTDARAEMTIPENTESLWSYGVTASDMPGGAEIRTNAAIYDDAGHELAHRNATATISVRPVTIFTTKMSAGIIDTASKTIRNIKTRMYPTHAVHKIYVSPSASVLMQPLARYLDNYEFSCTEQMVSRAMPYVVAPNDAILGTTYDAAGKKITETIAALQNRQNPDGSFELWTATTVDRNNESNDVAARLTSYVVEFMTLARENGFGVPRDMMSRAVDFLRTYAGGRISTPTHARTTARAIYVLTRNGYVTTAYIAAFEEYADKNMPKWESEISGAYIAASYKLMHQDARANAIIAKYKTSARDSSNTDAVANDAAYAYITRNIFGQADKSAFDAIYKYINGGDYSAYASAMAIMGLSGDVRNADDKLAGIRITADGTAIDGTVIGGAFCADIPSDARRITIKCDECGRDTEFYYSTVAQGYPMAPESRSDGLEITREYYDADGARVTSGTIGDIIRVKIRIRATGTTRQVPNIAITDMLPGGFIADAPTGDFDFADVREDRVIIYTTALRTPREITYTVRPGAVGQFQIPPVYAQSIYTPATAASFVPGGKFTVSNATK